MEIEQKPGCIPPLKVKASIKLVRWVLLISGIIFGIVKRKEYAAIEKVLREEEEKARPAREAFERCEKLRRNAAEMRELERIFLGTTSSDTEETHDETPCNGNIASKDNGLTLNDEKEKIVIPPNDNEVTLNNKSEETVASSNDSAVVLNDAKEETVINDEPTEAIAYSNEV